ncbi:MAG: hypothetical protein ACO24H_02375 [Polynucleobacter sp.]
MKKLAFRAIAFSVGVLIASNLAVGNFLTTLIARFFNSLNGFVRFIGQAALMSIDKDQYTYSDALAQQEEALAELDLVIGAHKVKEDAMKRRAWTMMHTLAINKIGSALHNQYDWEIPRVHQYLRDIVESIPGMVYCGGDDYEEE